MNKKPSGLTRRPSDKKGKMLRAITKKDSRKKKLRTVAASPAAGFNDDGKGLSTKITTALLVLLLFHLFAIAAIFLHSKVNKGATVTNSSSASQAVQQRGALDRINEEKPKVSTNEAYYMIESRDTYGSIAKVKGVDESELRRLNKNRSIKVGEVLKIPVRQIKVQSDALNTSGSNTRVLEMGDGTRMISDNGGNQVEIATTPKYRIHTMKQGDNFWQLSKTYGVTQQQIEQANPTLKATAVRVGEKVKIPIN